MKFETYLKNNQQVTHKTSYLLLLDTGGGRGRKVIVL